MKAKIKIIGIILIVIFIAAAIVYQSSKGISAQLLKVQPGTIAASFEEEGEVVPAEEHSIYSYLGGEIVNLLVEEGQQVKEDELLAVVDTGELKYQLKQLQSELKSLRGEQKRAQEPVEANIKKQELLVKQARNELEAAQENFEKIQKLYAEGAVTEKEFLDAQNILDAATINLQQQEESLDYLYKSSSSDAGYIEFYEGRAQALQSQIDLIKYKIAKSQIKAPAEGVVAELAVKKGDIVSPGFRLMKVFMENQYNVEVYIPVESAQEIAKGMVVKVVQDRQGEDVVFSAVVEKIAPSAVKKISALGLEESRIKVTVKPEAGEDIRLIPGATVDVEFITDKRENVLAVPQKAVFPYEMGEAVWVVKDGRAKIQPVETGFENSTHVVIEKGLSKGDLVILNPDIPGLKEGKKILQEMQGSNLDPGE